MDPQTGAMLLAKVEQLQADVAALLERTPDTRKTWLEPQELGALVGRSTRTLGLWREKGKLSSRSYRKNGRGFQYHRQHALADLKQEIS